MRYIFLIILIYTACILPAQPRMRDFNPAEAKRYKQFDSSFALLHFDTLRGKVTTLYSMNYRVRAEKLQAMVERCELFYEQKFPGLKFRTRLLVIDTADFKRVVFPLEGKAPYGIPFNVSKRNMIVIGADKKAVSKLFGPDETGDDVLSPWDDIAIHELGHIYWSVAKDIQPKEKWASEFIANVFSESYFAETIPGFLDDLNTSSQSAAPKYQPPHKTLEDFEKLYINVGARNYGWYQGKFSVLADKLYVKFKMQLIPLIADYYNREGEEAKLIDFLKQAAPEIAEPWLLQMK